MSQTFLFEELDGPTRDYLLEVRAKQGKKAPGVFAAAANPWPGIGVVLGPIIIIATLLCTLTTWLGVIYDDPFGVAMLQTAGLMLGGWMLVAALRVWLNKGSNKYAGHWVYADSLHLYQAEGEQITVTPIDDAHGAKFTHKYNNDTYQQSDVVVKLAGKTTVNLTVAGENRAEQLVAFINYLAWARGPDGGTRGELDPTTLGGLARYVVKNETEPVDGDGNLNFELFEVKTGDVPTDPQREGRAMPNLLPYAAIVLAAVVCFAVMRWIDIAFRDDAIFDLVTQPEEPRMLRAYLADPRNTRHRQDVLDRIPKFYDGVINAVRTNGADEGLRTGFADVLDSLRRADQPVVSIRVLELKEPVGGGDAAARRKALEEGLVDRVSAVFGTLAGPVPPPPGKVFTEQPPPVGHQLIAFAQMPEDAPSPHFDIGYAFHPIDGQPGKQQLAARVAIRVKLDGPPAATKEYTLPGPYTADQTNQALTDLKEQIIRDMVGGSQPGAAAPTAPAGPMPPGGDFP